MDQNGPKPRGKRLQVIRPDWANVQPLLLRLDRFVRLTAEEKDAVSRALGTPRQISSHVELLSQGRTTTGLTILLKGFACRMKLLRDGRRQITAYLVPGDACDFPFLASGPIDHTVMTLSQAVVSSIPLETIVGLGEKFPRVTRAFMRAATVEEAVTREWLTSLGQRTALQRMAHLFCELLVRLKAVGLVRQSSYDLPVTQAELGEALGLSTVHVNRTLQDLRRSELISARGGVITIQDPEKLAAIALFDPQYLGFGGEQQTAKAV